MAQTAITRRHYAIINFLRNRGKATFEEISNHLSFLSGDYDLNLSKRTFLRDIEDIASTTGIEILCDRKNGYVYYINEELMPDDIAQYIKESFEIYTAFHSEMNLKPYVQLETRRPQGTAYLYPLLRAIREKNRIEFWYQKYSKPEPELRKVYPLGLKESAGRWYLLAYCTERKDIRAFGLDRICNLDINNFKFKYKPEKSLDEIYKHCFGISMAEENTQPEEVILSFNPVKGKYILSYPLHHSQTTLIDNEEEIRIGLKVFITFDFVLELLKHTGEIRIIQPESLKSRYVDILKKGLEINNCKISLSIFSDNLK